MSNPPPETRVSFSERGVIPLELLRPDMLLFACWLCRDRALAEDVVQDAMLRAWRSRGALNDPTAGRSWLMTIVRRKHARLYARKRRELDNLDEVIDRNDMALAQNDASDETGLRLAILDRPTEYREPLVMQVIGGFSTEEIGRELHLTRPAVLTRLFRARNRLRVAYGLSLASDPEAPQDKP